MIYITTYEEYYSFYPELVLQNLHNAYEKKMLNDCSDTQ